MMLYSKADLEALKRNYPPVAKCPKCKGDMVIDEITFYDEIYEWDYQKIKVCTKCGYIEEIK